MKSNYSVSLINERVFVLVSYDYWTAFMFFGIPY